MGLEKAIITAMEVEVKIRDLYDQGYQRCKDPVGRRFFAMLRDDEQYHHDYLADRLSELRKGGEIQYPALELNVPAKDAIADCIGDAEKNLAVEDRGMIQQMLSNALKVEVRTTAFYTEMVSAFDGVARKMFSRFLEIEDGHIAAVQAELDYVMNTGYWFDTKEFDME